MSTFRSAKTRLQAGGNRICNLRIELAEEDPAIVTLLYWLPPLLPRLHRLSLDLHPVYFYPACDMLKHEAPLLEHLELSVSNVAADGPASVPADIFGGSAPALTQVELNCIELPQISVLAFASAVTVTLSWWRDEGLLFPYHIFTVFPHLSRLTFCGGWADFPRRVSPDVARRFSQLTHLDLAFVAGNNTAFLRHLDTQPIATIIIACPGDAEMLALSSHLHGPLCASICAMPLLGRCNMRSTIGTPSGPLRALEENSTADESLAGGLQVVRLLNLPLHLQSAHLYSLSVSASLWNLVIPHLRSTESLELLGVVLDAEISLTTLSDAAFPPRALHSLTIRGLYPFSRVPSDDLAHFCRRLAGIRVPVLLARIVVLGDLNKARDYCAEVEFI